MGHKTRQETKEPAEGEAANEERKEATGCETSIAWSNMGKLMLRHSDSWFNKALIIDCE